jgi:hypothetical protein
LWSILPPAKPHSFSPPCCIKSNPVAIRKMASRYGAQLIVAVCILAVCILDVYLRLLT